MTNRSRAPQRPADSYGSQASPPTREGVSDYDQLVGDYTNPILQPWAAQVVKKFGEISLAGITYPNASNQCWPFPMPFIFKQSAMMMIQQPDRIMMMYGGDHEMRRVRLNAPHASPLTPSWYGDSVGHYEGDTLVIDTVGVRTDHPYPMIDLFGTPYSDKLHVVERYRLRDYDDVKDAIERNIKENWLFAGDVFSKYRGKFLQLHVTIEDAGVFTTPWTATLTYVPGGDQIAETVCAENPHQYYYATRMRMSRKPRSRISEGRRTAALQRPLAAEAPAAADRGRAPGGFRNADAAASLSLVLREQAAMEFDYRNGSVWVDCTPPTLSIVLGSGPRPSAKARSSSRRPCNSPGKP